jgi:prepilin-type N-terminal cleavage/methylation domain-containing protein
MSKLLTKARAGVTLVELLVVILIVTILSVSMLPLLQPFVTEAQYAAEAIPVIGNLRTKIGLYQYDKGRLPRYGTNDLAVVQTWLTDTSDSEKYVPATYSLGSTAGKTVERIDDDADIVEHIGRKIDINYEDLKGKRSKPLDYQYIALSDVNNQSYVIACFGDGSGLKAGTGYAVCELNYTKAQKKYIGTWKRYKPVNDAAGAIQFGSTASSNGEELDYCYIPAPTDFDWDAAAAADGEPDEVKAMRKSGWEF